MLVEVMHESSWFPTSALRRAGGLSVLVMLAVAVFGSVRRSVCSLSYRSAVSDVLQVTAASRMVLALSRSSCVC
jgi:hypothetical protein